MPELWPSPVSPLESLGFGDSLSAFTERTLFSSLVCSDTNRRLLDDVVHAQYWVPALQIQHFACLSQLPQFLPSEGMSPKQLVGEATKFQKTHFNVLSTLSTAGFRLKMVVGLGGRGHEFQSLLTFAECLEFGRSSFLKINCISCLQTSLSICIVLILCYEIELPLNLLGGYFTTLFWSEGCVMPEVIIINAFFIKSHSLHELFPWSACFLFWII